MRIKNIFRRKLAIFLMLKWFYSQLEKVTKNDTNDIGDWKQETKNEEKKAAAEFAQ